MHNFIEIVSTIQNLKKTIDSIPTYGRAKGQMEGWTDPILMDPSGFHQGSNYSKISKINPNPNISTRIFKQR